MSFTRFTLHPFTERELEDTDASLLLAFLRSYTCVDSGQMEFDTWCK